MQLIVLIHVCLDKNAILCLQYVSLVIIWGVGWVNVDSTLTSVNGLRVIPAGYNLAPEI